MPSSLLQSLLWLVLSLKDRVLRKPVRRGTSTIDALSLRHGKVLAPKAQVAGSSYLVAWNAARMIRRQTVPAIRERVRHIRRGCAGSQDRKQYETQLTGCDWRRISVVDSVTCCAF